MIQFLLFLSYYEAYLKDTSDSYFQKLSFLKYSFNAHAKYDISIEPSFYYQTQMVFGLATKKEIEKIEKLKYSKEYCFGNKQLSQIQHNVTNKSAFYGEIPTKCSLTPYLFTCNVSYNILSSFEYSNGLNNQDYWCQVTLIFTLIYFILYLAVIFIGIFCYCKYKYGQISFEKKCHSTYIFILLILISGQNFYQYYFFQSHKNKEYFNEKLSDSYHIDFLGRSPIIVGSIEITILISFTAFLMLKSNVKCIIFVVILLSICMAGFELSVALNFLKVMRIILYSLYPIFFLINFFIKPMFTLPKCGYLLYLLGLCVRFPLGVGLLYATQYKLSTHYLTVILAFANTFIQIGSVSLFLFHIFRDDGSSSNANSLSIHHLGPYYTFDNDFIRRYHNTLNSTQDNPNTNDNNQNLEYTPPVISENDDVNNEENQENISYPIYIKDDND